MLKLPGPEDPPLFPPAPDPRAEHRRRVGERLAELAARDDASFVSARLARLARGFTEGLHEARNQAGGVAPAGRLDAQLRADLDAAAGGAPSPEAEEALRRRGEILLEGAFQKAAIAQEFALQGEQRSGLAQALADLGEAARLAPHDYASLAEQLRQTVDGAALLLSPETLKALKEAEPKRLAEAAVKGLIEGGAPEAAREGLKSGAFDLGGARVTLPLERDQVKGLTRLARAAERDAKARNRQEEASLRAEAAAGVGRRALDLELAVGRGEAGLTEIEEAAGDGVITAGKRTALEAMIAARQTEAEARARRAEQVAATVSGDGKALDSKDPEHRQAVEEAFAALQQQLPSDEFSTWAAGFVRATGIVPERLITRVSAGLRSQDANTQANAARLLAGIVESEPTSTPDPAEAPIFVPKPDEGFVFLPKETARAKTIVRYLDAGIAPAEAVRLADEDIGANDGVVRRDLLLRPGDLVDEMIKPLGPARPGDHLVGAQPLTQLEADTAEDGAGKDGGQDSEPGGPEGPRPKKPEEPKPPSEPKPAQADEGGDAVDPDELFHQYRENLREVEGGFVDRPGDRGGPTNKGVSQRTLDAIRKQHPEWNLPEKSKELSEEQINRIFREEFFDRPKIDKVAEIPGLMDEAPQLPEQLFDTGVLHGSDTAGRLLQQSLDEVLGTDLRETDESGDKVYDGNVGPKTRAAIAQAVREGKIQEVNDRMVDKRLEVMRKDPQFPNRPGWVRRAEKFRIESERS